MADQARAQVLKGIGLAIAAMACFAALDTTTKWVSLSAPLMVAMFFRYAFQAVATTAIELPRQGRSLLHTAHIGLHVLRGGLLLMGGMGSLGHFIFVQAFKRTPAAVLMPYMYAQIAFAMLGGWLMFSHVPDAWTIAGMALIAVCGAAGAWLTAHESLASAEAPEH
ncbi:EamA family transporter [Rhodoferax sp.]|uniref:EamA family transporter n=1 Tax=Rhodoferax sp. TaxID=50421 RepID=UPI002ACD8012|nr:EamA family transporter [Rhodoferax sp.]MDZ7918836.1 EamA family transporter [Rhodoferax sp.]